MRNGSILRRKIDDLFFIARVIEKGDPDNTGCIEKIEYLDDKKVEENVPVDECEELPDFLSDISSNSRVEKNTIPVEPNEDSEAIVEKTIFPDQSTSCDNRTSQEIVDSIHTVEDFDSVPSRVDSTCVNIVDGLCEVDLKKSEIDIPLEGKAEDSVTKKEEKETKKEEECSTLPVEGLCEVCGVVTKFRCARCGVIFFCSREHQRVAWGIDLIEGNADTLKDPDTYLHKDKCIPRLEGPIKPTSSSKIQTSITNFIGPLSSQLDGLDLSFSGKKKRVSHDDGSGGDMKYDSGLIHHIEQQFGDFPDISVNRGRVSSCDDLDIKTKKSSAPDEAYPGSAGVSPTPLTDRYLGMLSHRNVLPPSPLKVNDVNASMKSENILSPPGTPPTSMSSSLKRDAFTTPPRSKRRAQSDLGKSDVRTIDNYSGDDEGDGGGSIYHTNVASLLEMGIVTCDSDGERALRENHNSLEEAIEWVFGGGLNQPATVNSERPSCERPIHSSSYMETVLNSAGSGGVPYLDASMLETHTKHAISGGVDGGYDTKYNKFTDKYMGEENGLNVSDAGVGSDDDLPDLLPDLDVQPPPPPGRNSSPINFDLAEIENEVQTPAVDIDPSQDLISLFELNITRGVTNGPPWFVSLVVKAYRVQRKQVTDTDAIPDNISNCDDTIRCDDMLLSLSPNVVSSTHKVSSWAMLIPGADVITVSRTTFPARTEEPYNWMDPSNDVERAKEFGNYIEVDQNQVENDEVAPQMGFVLKIPISQRIVSRSVLVEDDSDNLERVYEKAFIGVNQMKSSQKSIAVSDHLSGSLSALSSLGGSFGGASTTSTDVVPDEAKVSQLEDMGFEGSMARNALKSNNNSIDAAVNHLISLM